MEYGRTVALLGLAGLLGCGGELESSDIEDTSEEVTYQNGVKFNGVKFNGVKFNGVKFNGVKFNGATLSGVKLNGSSLQGKKSDGTLVGGTALKNAELTGSLANGSSVTLVIAAVSVSGDKYSYAVKAKSTGEYICGKSGATPIKAYALAGRWNEGEGVAGGGSWINDESVFTFACKTGALGKCVDWGYKPWTKHNGHDLKEYHQACTRMVRADYCGNGKSHTVNGTAINVLDPLWINKEDRSPTDGYDWWFEAYWGPNGPICVSNDVVRGSSSLRAVPACAVTKCTNVSTNPFTIVYQAPHGNYVANYGDLGD